MQRVKYIRGYKFDSCDYIKICDSMAHQKIKDMSELLDTYIERIESRSIDLKDAREFKKTGKQLYLFKNNESDYGYVDDNGKNYEYKQINNKPILIDADFNLYEIIEYVDLDDIGQDKGTRSCIVLWIDKIVRVKPINQSL